MKKLICLLMIATLLVGCNNKKDDAKSGALANGIDKDIPTEKTEEKKDVEDNEEPPKKEDTQDNSNTETSKKNDTSKKSDTGNTGSSTGNSGGNNHQPQPKPEPTPPVQEPVTPPPPPAPPVVETPTEQRGKADAVMAQINAYREQNGKTAFVVTNYLINNSNTHAYAMAERRALWHSGAAECITNYDDPFSAWINSPEHNRLLLSNNETGAVSIYYVDGYYYSVFQTLP